MKTSLVTLGLAASMLQPVIATANNGSLRPVKDLAQANTEIHWPHGLEPTSVDAFVHNEIFINASAETIWRNLVEAGEWSKWYSNSSDMRIADGRKVELEANIDFTWKTFGFPIKSTVHEFVLNQRLGWFGRGDGIQAYHTWLIIPRGTGCDVVTEEGQVGLSAVQYNVEQPTAMYDGHHWWLTALKYRSERNAQK